MTSVRERKRRLQSLLAQLEAAPPTPEREALIHEVRKRLLAVDGITDGPSAFEPRPSSADGFAHALS
jgi:hypothetical protein